MINNKYKHCLSKIGQGGGVWDEFLFAIGSVWVQPYDVHVYTVSVQDMIAIEQKTYSVTNEFPGSPLIKTGEGGDQKYYRMPVCYEKAYLCDLND